MTASSSWAGMIEAMGGRGATRADRRRRTLERKNEEDEVVQRDRPMK